MGSGKCIKSVDGAFKNEEIRNATTKNHQPWTVD